MFDRQLLAISFQIEKRLGIKGDDLKEQLDKAGRKLPRKVRRQIENLLKARSHADHPKLASMINWNDVRFALKRVQIHLQGYDLKKDRRRHMFDLMLGMVANVTLAILFVISVVFVVK